MTIVRRCYISLATVVDHFVACSLESGVDFPESQYIDIPVVYRQSQTHQGQPVDIFVSVAFFEDFCSQHPLRQYRKFFY